MTLADVLLIDDEVEAVIKPVSAAFNYVNIPLDTASTWDAAVDQFLIGGHALVLADWNLPGSKNGLALLAQLKLLRPNTRLILFSGFLDEAQRLQAEKLPFVDRALSKGLTLVESLIEEAQVASARAAEATDWTKLALGYRAAAATNMVEVEALEQILRAGESA